MQLQSENIADLVKSLVKAQAAISGAVINKNNPHFKSKYADLAAVIEACKEPLAENELAFVQSPTTIEGKPHLVTTLYHSSGQWIRSYYPLSLEKQTSQGQGSAMTYGRRYALASMLGIPQVDDDANEAEKNETTYKKEPQKKLLTKEELTEIVQIMREFPEQYQGAVQEEVKKISGAKTMTQIEQKYKTAIRSKLWEMKTRMEAVA